MLGVESKRRSMLLSGKRQTTQHVDKITPTALRGVFSPMNIRQSGCPSLQVLLILALALASSAQQGPRGTDSRPRVYFETGPPSEFFSEADLQKERNSFAEGFPSYCPGAVVTENRSKANYVVRLSPFVEGAGENATLNYSMAVIQGDGDQVFADSASGVGIDLQMFAREACAVIVHQMDSHTVFMITQQAKRRLLRVGFQVTYHADPKKFNDKTRQIVESGIAREHKAMFEYGFSQECFCIDSAELAKRWTAQTSGRPDPGGGLDYRFQVDEWPPSMSLTVQDRSGKEVFSKRGANEDLLRDLLKDACQAILLRESAEAREK